MPALTPQLPPRLDSKYVLPAHKIHDRLALIQLGAAFLRQARARVTSAEVSQAEAPPRGSSGHHERHRGLVAFAAHPSWKPPAMILMEPDLAERAGQLKIYALFKI